ncbi:DsbE family thiol:disulfide interchange protein [Methylocystis bryophila]|uniref:DsbE family thiol:disulfide interchange protein n=1 Tax=Methylocystis bryophila TaxID=655015 RepID=UPI001FD8A1B8|nr:DsbE family thiol:disulfide interchange protein [Methylocystis bryophila]
MALLVVLSFALTNNPGKMPSMLIDKALPGFTLTAVDGERELTSGEIAGQVALVNVFASWCPVCRQEHSVLDELAEKGVRIYGIDWKDTRQAAQRWLGSRHSPYVQTGFDESGRVGLDLGVTGVPETFLVDRSGRVRYRHAGAMTEEAWREVFEPLIRSFRSEP